jgi:hypothetical protein
VLRRGESYVIPLWYGSDIHWVKNVLAAGACDLRTRGRDVRLTEPRLSIDPARRLLPGPLRWAAALVGLTEFLDLRVSEARERDPDRRADQPPPGSRSDDGSMRGARHGTERPRRRLMIDRALGTLDVTEKPPSHPADDT